MARKILICGATGFLGRNIAERFAENPEFKVTGTYFNSRAFYKKGISWERADLTNPKDVKRVVEGKDIVIQMAANTSGAKQILERPYIHVTDNAVMNSLLLRESFEQRISHFIFPSSTILYQSSEKPLKETDLNLKKDFYPSYFASAWTKLYIEKMCEFFSRCGIKGTVIRQANIYGPYDKYSLERSHVFGATIAKVANAKDGDEIAVWGDGKEKRDLLYVRDLVDFVELAIQNQSSQFEIYNAGTGIATSVGDLVKKVIKCSGKNLKIKYDLSKPTIKTSLCVDTSKAREELGWTSATPLDSGISDTLNWYAQNIKGAKW